MNFEIMPKTMKEKRVFLIFVSESERSYRNEEISNCYMNKIAIDENDQLEILKIQYLQIPISTNIFTGKIKTRIQGALNFYQAKIKEVKV